MNDICVQARSFGARKAAEIENARQRAALHLACGIDLAEALAAEPELKLKFIRRIERAIERERLKGIHRHWSYDLNRHIALKRALDRLSEHVSRKWGPASGKRHAQRQGPKAWRARPRGRNAP